MIRYEYFVKIGVLLVLSLELYDITLSLEMTPKRREKVLKKLISVDSEILMSKSDVLNDRSSGFIPEKYLSYTLDNFDLDSDYIHELTEYVLADQVKNKRSINVLKKLLAQEEMTTKTARLIKEKLPQTKISTKAKEEIISLANNIKEDTFYF